MASGQDAGGGNLERALRLLPPAGLNWGAIANSPKAEAEFLATLRPLLHPDFETRWRHSETEGESRTGLEATMAALRRIRDAFEELVAVPELYVDLGDRVLVLLTREGRTAEGHHVAGEGAATYIFEHGLLRCLKLYADRALALADAGLSETEVRERAVPVAELAER